MMPEEDELRRALAARSGSPSPEFLARLSRALATRPASTRLMAAIALATAIVLTVTSVGVLVAARQFGRHAGNAASGPRVETPIPSSGPIEGASGIYLSAPSAEVGWALVDKQHLYRSTDQGVTWVQRSSPPTAPQGAAPPLISFIDATTGWELVPTSGDAQCMREDAELWRTIDGAATWKRISQTSQRSYLVVDQCKDAMHFTDAVHGSVATGDPGTDLSSMYTTQDGGVTWTPLGLLHRQDTYAFRVFSITTVDGNEMVEAHTGAEIPNAPAPGVNHRPVGYIFVNEAIDPANGNWLGGVERTIPDRAVSNVAFLTPTHWLILQPGLETTDAGVSWHPFATDYVGVQSVPSVFVFVNDRLGYATVQGRIHRTTDGGVHWQLAVGS